MQHAEILLCCGKEMYQLLPVNNANDAGAFFKEFEKNLNLLMT